RAPYAFHLSHHSAAVAQRVLEGVPALIRLLNAIVLLVTELLVVAGFVLLLLRVTFLATLVATAIVGTIVGVFVRAIRVRYHRLGARHFELSASALRLLQQTLEGLKQIRALGRDGYFGELLARAHAARTRVFVSHSALESVPRLVTETAFV